MMPQNTSGVDRAFQAAVQLIAEARSGTLASLIPDSGHPYASLVNVASHGHEPLLLLSRLAWHTRNILNDARACLLLTGETPGKDPLTLPRVSLMGRVRGSEETIDREIYLKAHPSARSYCDFADFSFYRLNVETAHYVAGFGQIITIERPWFQGQAVERP